jgi:hypothetical protein
MAHWLCAAGKEDVRRGVCTRYRDAKLIEQIRISGIRGPPSSNFEHAVLRLDVFRKHGEGVIEIVLKQFPR